MADMKMTNNYSDDKAWNCGTNIVRPNRDYVAM